MESIWWNQVPNAAKMLRDLNGYLYDDNSVILQDDGTLPWKNYFLDKLFSSVQASRSSKRIDYPDVHGNPGEYFLEHYFKEEIRYQYRPSKTYASFISKEDDSPFHDLYAWMEISDPGRLSELTDFISEYVRGRGEGKAKAAFFIVYNGGDVSKVGEKKEVKIVRFDDYINPFDKRVFVALASSSIKEPLFIKEYLEEMAATAFGDDIELCAECIKQYGAFLDDPYKFIKDITEKQQKSDGTDFLKKTEDEYHYAIWKAQVRAIYPALEVFRQKLIKKYEKEIWPHLPMTVEKTGTVYKEPKEVELGGLRQLAGSRKIKITTDEYDHLHIFWNTRNKLSHLKTLTFKEIKDLDI